MKIDRAEVEFGGDTLVSKQNEAKKRDGGSLVGLRRQQNDWAVRLINGVICCMLYNNKSNNESATPLAPTTLLINRSCL